MLYSMKGHDLCTKKTYGSASEAWADACEIRNRLRREGQTEYVPRSVYECPTCGFWHMTSQRQGKAAA